MEVNNRILCNHLNVLYNGDEHVRDKQRDNNMAAKRKLKYRDRMEKIVDMYLNAEIKLRGGDNFLRDFEL